MYELINCDGVVCEPLTVPLLRIRDYIRYIVRHDVAAVE